MGSTGVSEAIHARSRRDPIVNVRIVDRDILPGDQLHGLLRRHPAHHRRNAVYLRLVVPYHLPRQVLAPRRIEEMLLDEVGLGQPHAAGDADHATVHLVGVRLERQLLIVPVTVVEGVARAESDPPKHGRLRGIRLVGVHRRGEEVVAGIRLDRVEVVGEGRVVRGRR